MSRRYVAIWFYHLTTDWFTSRHPELKHIPFVLTMPQRGRMVIKAANKIAALKGIKPGMVTADARAIFPQLQVFDDQPELTQKLLNKIAEWCLRYTPVAGTDMPDCVLLDVSGCAHLWGGESNYLKDIHAKLTGYGYHARIAIADTIGAAWAISRYGKITALIPPGKQADALLSLPPAALRLEQETVAKLEKLGLYTIGSFINMPRAALYRRFGPSILTRLDQALGKEMEVIEPIRPLTPYQERLPCLEPICTATGIEIAVNKLLDTLCQRLGKEEKGLRSCMLRCYRVDGNVQQIQIGTTRPSRNTQHLFKLFEVKISALEPDLGFELFILEAPVTEDLSIIQEAIWNHGDNNNDIAIGELLDKIAGKLGANTIHRYLPDEHYLPERSVRLAATLQEQPVTDWFTGAPRPLHLLTQPELIQVTVAIPDYPPTLFHYQGQIHRIGKADGPERIEQEWWLQPGQYRDYYCVEDEQGRRYWIFRLGHYNNNEPKWFIHGFFA